MRNLSLFFPAVYDVDDTAPAPAPAADDADDDAHSEKLKNILENARVENSIGV